MKQFYSLSRYPGTTGERYFNTLFKRYNLPYVYTAVACEDIKDGVLVMRSCHADGFSVSMPFKTDVIKELDFIENVAARFKSCNTVYNHNRKLHGYNTDYFGAVNVLNRIPAPSNIAILGDGAMGSMFKQMVGNAAIVYSRKGGNWEDRHVTNDVIVNCTPFGTSVSDSPFEKLPKCNLIIDLAIKPNQLEEQAKTAGVKYISGIEFYKHQFIRQFGIYTKHQITLSDLENI
jgi:shikimate dehydrogenase